MVVLKWKDGEFQVTADHALLVSVRKSEWVLKEASAVCPLDDELLVLPSPTALDLQAVVITEVEKYQAVQDVIEIEMACPGDMLLASSASADGPYVVVFGKQPDRSWFDILIMELSRLPHELLELFDSSDSLRACRFLAGQSELKSGTSLFLLPDHWRKAQKLLSAEPPSGLKGRHLILSAGYKAEIERLINSLPRKHNVKVKSCKRLVDECSFFRPDGEVLYQRKTFLSLEPEPSLVPTTVSTTDARSATKHLNPRLAGVQLT